MKSPLVFRIFKNQQIYAVKQFIDEERIVIGNNAEAQIELNSDEVSAVHCLVEKRDQQYYICDLGSSIGTFKGGLQVLDEPIVSGESFLVGPYTVQFFVGALKSISNQSQPAIEIKDGHGSLKPRFTEASASTAGRSRTEGNSKPDRKVGKTFAPGSSVGDIRDLVRGGQGSKIEVLVAWKERIINTYHFDAGKSKTLGPYGDISVPEGSAPDGWKLLDLQSSVIINLAPEMRFEVLKDGEIRQMQTPSYKLNQGEACFIELINGMQLVIRYAPKTKAIIFDSPLILGSSEFTGILAALIIAVMASLIVSINRPKASKSEEEIQRVAQVIFTTPPVELVAQSDVVQPPPPVMVEEKKKTEEEKKKALILDETKAEKTSGEEAKTAKKLESMKTSGQAENIKAKDPKLKNKMFTSTKSGGAVKTGASNGANAQSKDPDPNNSGLLAAFGEGGARSKLDQVYSGSGELIGAGEKAKGVSGFNSDRNGDDLGAKMKDTGAGGNGTATQGIAGVGTKGRGTGMSGYGSGMGFGDKDRVQIAAGGGEENFTGSIDKEAVRRVVKSALSQFKACYEREYRQDTSLEGKLVITWEIHAQGVAKNARVVKDKSTINNAIVEECVRTRILALIFPEPPPGTAAEVTYPFVFKGQKL